MKICVMISGTIRSPDRSLLTLSRLARRGHTIDVFLFTYSDVAASVDQHWSLHLKPGDPSLQPIEPTPELLDKYRPAHIALEDWPTCQARFRAQADDWVKRGVCEDATRVAALSQFYGIGQVGKLAGLDDPVRLGEYDMVLRLRFDGYFGAMPSDVRPGWVLPSDQDFSAADGADLPVLNDRLGLFFVDKADLDWSHRMFWGYVGTYGRVNELIEADCPYHPEAMLRWSMVLAGAWESIRRRDLIYAIHADAIVLSMDDDRKLRS